jgi:RNA polymerase sigma-B factor
MPESPTVASTVSEDWLLARYQRTGDRIARERLVCSMAPLVRKIARGYRAQGHEEDLLQVAWIALNNAIERYDPAFGVPLRTFAIPTMHGELRRYLRDHSWSVHVPRPLQERVLKVSRTRDRLSAEYGRPPTTDEISRAIGLTHAQTLEALQAASGYAARSLDAPAGDDGDDAGTTLGQRLGCLDDQLERAEDLATLRGLRHLLDGRERHLLFLRYVEDRTQTDIAAITGTSQMSVSRTLRRTLDRLSDAGTAQGTLREQMQQT